jgi:hypothetical protein
VATSLDAKVVLTLQTALGHHPDIEKLVPASSSLDLEAMSPEIELLPTMEKVREYITRAIPLGSLFDYSHCCVN